VTVAPADGSVFRGVSGLVATANNGIWFSEARGLIHIEEDEARRLEKDPGYRVKYQALDVLDGLSDGLQSRYPERNMIEGTDGRLWFATALGVIGLDPKRIPTRPLPPQAAILSLIANEQKHLLPASAKISLPARTTSLQFVYTAGSLAIPERVRFRHKLDGQDKDWQEAGTRREAFYTNLGPGSYRFHVMASNGDGLWKEAGTTAGFLIQPAFFQTGWFFSLCVAAGGVFLWMLYILRIRHVTAQVQTRLGERMMERERIARELHDTLLQGFSGLVLKFQAAMKQLPQDLPARQIMESALDRADEVLLEGRTRVRDLRSESIERQDLAAALEDCGEELQHEGAPSLGLVITGTPRPLDPIVYDEVYRIGREALVNAFQHSKASTIEVEITYEPSGFRLRVRDDGCGIHQNVLDHGRPGHWGLAGIRERAQNIGGKLTIWSHAGAGTELELTIPARLVYKLIPQESRWRKWWKR
jgi:signal transduction histidine kinase